MAQSAGNIKNGSSETIRGNTYDLFRKSYNFYYRRNLQVDNLWLDWLVGFIEGDGAILSYSTRDNLIITQKDPKVLESPPGGDSTTKLKR